MKKSPLAQAQFWISAIGTAGVIIGSYFIATSGSVTIAAIGSIAMIVGAVLIGWLFIAQGREVM